MDNKARLSKLKDNEYQQIFGVRKPTFEAMLALLGKEFEQLHKQGGRPPKLRTCIQKRLKSVAIWEIMVIFSADSVVIS